MHEGSHVHSDQLHTLEREGGLNNLRKDGKELVQMGLAWYQVGGGKSARVVPVLYPAIA